MANKNEYFSKQSKGLASIIKIEKRKKNNLIISPIPINITKNNYKNSKFYTSKEINFNSFLSSNYSLNSTKNLSLSKEKYRDYYYDSANNINHYKSRNYKEIQTEVDNIKKILKEKKMESDKLKNALKKLKIYNNTKKLELKNNLSDKETLEEKYKTIINEIKTNNRDFSNINESNYIPIKIEDIKLNNNETYIKRIIEIFNKLNIDNYKNPIFHKFITHSILKISKEFYLYLNNNNINNNIKLLINNYFSSISSAIISYQNIIKLSENVINFLLRIILKINIIGENVNNIINYLENNHKVRKNDLKEKINKIQKEITDLEHKKMYLEKFKKNLIKNINVTSKSNSPYCEKIVNKTRSNQKEVILNKKISTIIHSSTDYLNKSKSSSIGKKKFLNENTEKKMSKYLTSNRKEKSNMKKISIYHSKNASKSNIIKNGISCYYSSEKKNKFKTKINFSKNIIKNYLNKPREVKYFSNNKNNKSINEFIKNNQLTDKNNNKTFNNKNNIMIKTKLKDCSTSYNNNSVYNDNISTKTERNYKHIYNNEKNGKNGVKKYNFTNLANLISNTSVKNLKTSSSSKNNLLKTYLTKRNNQERIINSNNSPCNLKNNNEPKRKISKINNQILILNTEQLNRIQFKNIMNFDNSEKSKNIKTNNQKIIESFCYYKILEKDSKLFNPLNNRIDLNKLGYNEGFIFIDPSKDCLIIKSKNLIKNKKDNYLNLNNNDNYNNNNSYTISKNLINNINNINNIELRDINNIYIDKIMKNVIKIHNVFLKYNQNKYKNNNQNKTYRESPININKLLNDKEIVKIKDMEQSEKIKAGLCNFFSFILEFNFSEKIEFVLINFYNFNTWFNYLQNIVNKNNKSKMANSDNSYFNNYNFGINKVKYTNINLKNKQKYFKRSFTENSNHKYYSKYS